MIGGAAKDADRDLVKAVYRVCPRWMADRADDLVQVALMRVMEIQRKKEGTAEFSPFYLKKAAYSAMIDEIRRLRRRQEVSMEGTGEEDAAVMFDPAAPDPDPQPPGPQRAGDRQPHGLDGQEGREPGLPGDVGPARLSRQ